MKLASRLEVIIAAYKACSKNKGAGTPGSTPELVIDLQLENLNKMSRDLGSVRYKFTPARRVEIKKKDGGTRPLTIPSAKDRVVLQAIKIVMEPIFEDGFSNRSFGFRPKRRCDLAFGYINTYFNNAN